MSWSNPLLAASISEAFVAIFEGFVGTEREIDAIFEFEGADTALERTDFPGRGLSDSTRSESVAHSAPPQTSASSSMPQRPTPSVQIPTSPRSPRAKANTLLGRSVDIVHSPLAQRYMPLVVDEDTTGNAPDPSANLAPGIGYGPAGRRRTSIYRRPGNEIVGTSVAQSGATSAWKYSNSDSRKEVMDNIPISQSPDSDYAAQPKEKPKTIAETEQAEETSGGVALTARLVDIEKRQIRMEELLLKLVKQ
jgi:hypothetical protein